MPLRRLLLSALVVAALNIGSVVLGYLCYLLAGVSAQLAVQVPVALLSGIGLVLVWAVRFPRLGGLRRGVHHLAVLLLALPVGAAAFAVAHYVFSGYLTSFGNILALWAVQLAENVPALLMAHAVTRRGERNAVAGGGPGAGLPG
jgi:hypothetical protein